MNTLQAIEQRRAVKKYDPSFVIPADDQAKLEALVMLSPTAFNIQNWRFLRVSDPTQRQRIREAAWNQAQVTDASLLYVLCATLDAWKEPRKYWRHASPEVQAWMEQNITAYYKDKPQVQRDEAMRSCGMAAQTLMLAAKSMGYDSCPMDGFDFEKVAQIIKLPANHVLCMFVVIGKAVAAPHPRSGPLAHQEVFVANSF